MKIKVGSRESRLAVRQAQIVMEKIRQFHPAAQLEIVTMKTTGDRILHKTLDKVGGKGLFIKELDLALRECRIDLAVHSLKDMPMEEPRDFPILACTRREDPRDVLVLRKGLPAMPADGVIGCSSLRRKLQLGALFPSARIENIRGNVLTRLEKLDAGEYDALVLAAAGLLRLGLEERISRYFSVEEILPAAGQGIMAVQGSRRMKPFTDCASDPDAVLAAAAERAFVRELDGGCSSPVAAHAERQGQAWLLRGLYYEEETGTYRIGTRTYEMEGTDPALAARMGRELADELRG
ncbi:hydroxymethylbilane synthase [Mordavella massiliensis]|uniref:Porphobilinogen deaminase n=1 Tax=Mordavella massiliensis TaxID=1871024 RepID=A0A938XBY8_9CLOT|nr:hydroxymethylbilane synthase [Mordavella massiliensis]MBM6948989.1 hydroxymethylbilane synthase [Mordavella massiliensis]